MDYYNLAPQMAPQTIIGRNDTLTQIEQQIFSNNLNIMAIIIFGDDGPHSCPPNSLIYENNLLSVKKFYLPIREPHMTEVTCFQML